MNLSKTGLHCHSTIRRGLEVLLPAVAAIVLVPAGSARGLQAQATGGALAAYDFGRDPVQFDLGKPLTEISGLAVAAGGRLFAHHDERALVFELDRTTGKVTRTFRVGRNGLRGDFEGMAIAGSDMFLISSDGVLLRFRESGADETVEYARSNTGTRRFCREIEGLDYDAGGRALLLACKFTSGRALRDRLVVLRYSLDSRKLDASPLIAVPLQALEKFGEKPELSPSGIAVHPGSGTLFIVAARENLLVELDRSGRLLGVVDLRGKVHHQPEGIAFDDDGTLYIADEGRTGRATLTVYPADRSRSAR